MKSLDFCENIHGLLFLTLILCSGLKANPITNSIEDESISQKIESVLESACLTNADYNAFTELKVALDAFKYCMGQNLRPPTNDEEVITITCTEIRSNGYKCLEAVLEKLEPCLDLEERYFPHFLLTSHNSTFENACKNDGKILQGFISNLRSVKCDPSVQYMRGVLVESCLSKKLLKNLFNPDYILRKSDLCSELETTKQCFVDELQSHCNNGTNILEFITANFDNYLSFCSSNV